MSDACTSRGTLFLVVGPSGAGKDSLIAGARVALAGRPFVFARRVITRPAGTDGEAYDAVTPATFARMRAAGRFGLWWEAHGFCYGIAREIESDLAAGRAVVANVSRTVVETARRRYRPVRIVHVVAAPETLAARLAQRGRETEDEIARRLARTAVTPPPNGADVVTIRNDGSLADAVARFVAVLTAGSSGDDRHS